MSTSKHLTKIPRQNKRDKRSGKHVIKNIGKTVACEEEEEKEEKEKEKEKKKWKTVSDLFGLSQEKKKEEEGRKKKEEKEEKDKRVDDSLCHMQSISGVLLSQTIIVLFTVMYSLPLA